MQYKVFIAKEKEYCHCDIVKKNRDIPAFFLH